MTEECLYITWTIPGSREPLDKIFYWEKVITRGTAFDAVTAALNYVRKKDNHAVIYHPMGYCDVHLENLWNHFHLILPDFTGKGLIRDCRRIKDINQKLYKEFGFKYPTHMIHDLWDHLKCIYQANGIQTIVTQGTCDSIWKEFHAVETSNILELALDMKADLPE